ncbi:hypothetical protein HK099_002192, partial [Clydaea vesicula]
LKKPNKKHDVNVEDELEEEEKLEDKESKIVFKNPNFRDFYQLSLKKNLELNLKIDDKFLQNLANDDQNFSPTELVNPTIDENLIANPSYFQSPSLSLDEYPIFSDSPQKDLKREKKIEEKEFELKRRAELNKELDLNEEKRGKKKKRLF